VTNLAETTELERAISHLPDRPTRPKGGPIPRSIRWAGARKKAEQRVAQLLPDAIEALGRAAKQGDVKASRYLIEFLLGAPARADRAPADDHSLPADARSASTIERMVLADLSDHALAQVKLLILRDLQAQGKVSSDATIASPLEEGKGKPPPPPQSKT